MKNNKNEPTTEQALDILVSDVLTAVKSRGNELDDMSLKDLLALLLSLLRFRVSVSKSNVSLDPFIEATVEEAELSLQKSVLSKLRVYNHET